MFLIFRSSLDKNLLFGPVYLIFNLEKSAFNKEIVKEKHLLTILQGILIGILLIISIMANYVLVDLSNEERMALTGTYIFSVYGIIILLQAIFFAGGFLYLSRKTEGALRINTFLVAIGYIWEFIVNLFLAVVFIMAVDQNSVLPYTSPDFPFVIGMTYIFRLIGLLIMSYGLLKLYYKKIATKD